MLDFAKSIVETIGRDAEKCGDAGLKLGALT
jgi:hypothetical protein